VQNPARSLAQPRTEKLLSSGDLPSWLECPIGYVVSILLDPQGIQGNISQRLEIAGRRLNVVAMIQIGERPLIPCLCYLLSTWTHYLDHCRQRLV
jgi:hypothetical protein